MASPVDRLACWQPFRQSYLFGCATLDRRSRCQPSPQARYYAFNSRRGGDRFYTPGHRLIRGLLLLISLYAFFGAPSSSLIDSAVLALLGDRKERFGRVRLWGTIGYGVIAPFAGELIGRLGLKWAFWGYALLMLGGFLIITQIPFHQSRSTGSFRGGMRVLLTNPPWMLFLVMAFIAGIGLATISNYLFVYMQSLGSAIH